MSAVLSDYFLNIDIRTEQLAAEDAAFESWLECQDLAFLLGSEADDLLMLAFSGHDIRNRVHKLVHAEYDRQVLEARRDYEFERAYADGDF